VNLLPVWVSLQVAALATMLTLLTGLPVAWALGRRRFPGHGLAETAVILPLVLPPTVLGYYLLVLISRTGPIGGFLARFGVDLAFTLRAAVLASWIGAFGLFVRAAQSGFELVDGSLEDAARTLGRSEWALFWTVTLPLAWRAVLAATVVAFCRAMGDFGLTLVVAGNLRGPDQTMPLAIYDQVQGNRLDLANELSLVTLGLVGFLLLFVGRLSRARR